jgi:GAF domain-containing protein
VDDSIRLTSPSEHVLRLGGALLDDDALDRLLQQVVLVARQAVAGASSVSITVADGGRYRTSNSTAEEALAIDQAQYDEDDGPCLQALRSGRQVEVRVGSDAETRSLFDQKAQELGVRSILSTPLVPRRGAPVGALNIYTHEGDGFNRSATESATVLGQHAAILFGNALALSSATRLNEQLRQAVASREIIGEAKGILMERQGCTREEAFDVLRRASQRENRKLRDVAEELVLRVESRKQTSSGRE